MSLRRARLTKPGDASEGAPCGVAQGSAALEWGATCVAVCERGVGMACFLVLLRTARPCGWRAVLGPAARRHPGSERHQAQDLVLSVRIDPAGRRVCDSSQIHAGARFHDGVDQAYE